ncbi:MAG: ParA family protein [Nevskiaceae bacterium]|nr:MAG: ParA family protein [Nevskiaceae bacterium]TBR72177.1 MAG: ParA family protein [Nevskiaceae bacterium]
MNARPQVWSVTNQKGGVGKTTTAVTLAGLHALDGKRCLIVDLDPHASASEYFGLSGTTLFDALQNPAAPIVPLTTSIPGLTLLPACSELAALGNKSGAAAGGATGLALKRLVDRLTDIDIVIVDGPPTLGVLMINVIVAADRMIVPTLTDPLALRGVASLDQTLKQIERSLGHRAPWTIVATQVDRRTRSAHEGYSALEQQWGTALWDEYIPMDTQLREASARGQVIEQFAPDSRAARAYRHLYRHLTTQTAPGNRP